MQEQLDILQAIADHIDSEKYYSYSVKEKKDGFYLVPDESRFFGDRGEFMGSTFKEAKANIVDFVNWLQ